MATLLSLAASSFIGDQDAQLVAGDVAVPHASHLGRPCLAFDDTAEEAAVSVEFEMPTQYSGSGLSATIHFAAGSDMDPAVVAVDVFVEAKTPNADTLDMVAESSWAAVNAGTKSLGTDNGDPISLDIALTNADSVAAGDLVRIGIRRDTDSASDDAVGDMFVYSVTLEDNA
jgi:hypothetical protein